MTKIISRLLLLTGIFMFGAMQVSFAETYPEFCAVFNRTLKTGDVGQDVKRLQVVLGQEGIAYLSSTGYYGPATTAAVKVFQQRNGIYAVGKVGPQTFRFMKNLWCFGEGPNSTGPDTTYIPINTNNPELPVSGWVNGTNWGNSSVPEVSLQPVSSSANNVTISWNTRAVNSCSISQDSSNSQPVQNVGQNIFTLYGESRFTLKCLGYNGREYSKQIIVRPNQSISTLPTVNVSINPSQVLVGQQATIYWTSQNTSYCTSNIPGYNSNLQTSGSIPLTVSSGSQFYSVTCYNQNGQSITQSVSANSTQNSAPVINNFTYSNNYLAWGTSNANSCTISGGNLSSQIVQTNGNLYVATPSTNSTWTLTCFGNSNLSVSRQVNFSQYTSCLQNNNCPVNGYFNAYKVGNSVNLSWQSSLSTTGNSCSLYRHSSLGTTDGSYADNTKVLIAGNLPNTGTYSTTYIGTAGNFQYPGEMQFTLDCNGSKQFVSVSGSGTTCTANCGGTSNILVRPQTATISQGQSVSLEGYLNNINSCTITGGAYSRTPVNIVSGSLNRTEFNYNQGFTFSVSPTTSTNYYFECMGNSGQTLTATANITVSGGTVIDTQNNVGVTLTSNKTNYVSGDSVVFTATVRNNGSSMVRFRNDFSVCIGEDVSMKINGVDFHQYFGNIRPLCAPTSTGLNYSYVNLQPGQSYIRTFTATIPSLQGTISTFTPVVPGTHNAVATLRMINDAGVTFATANSNTLTFTITGTTCITNCGTSNLSINSSANKTTYSVGENITINTVVTNVGSTVATFQSGSSSCPSDVRVTVNGVDFYTYTNQQNRICTMDFRTETLQPGQSLTRTFTGTIPNSNNLSTLTIVTSMPAVTTVTDTDYISVQNAGTGSLSANIYASPTNTTYSGQPVTLTWSSSGATYCNITGGNTNLTSQPTSGSTTVYPTVNSSYYATCYNSSNQSVQSNVTYVTVAGGNTGVVTVNISASPNPMSTGQLTNLTWYSSNANYCNIIGGNTNLANQPANGSYAVSPSQSTNYTITCYNNNGQNASSYVYVTLNGNTTGNNSTSLFITSNQNRNVNINVYKAPYNSCFNGYINWGYNTSNTYYTYPNVQQGSACQIGVTHTYANPGTYTITAYENNVQVASTQVTVQ